jgi:hypothetical protein
MVFEKKIVTTVPVVKAASSCFSCLFASSKALKEELDTVVKAVEPLASEVEAAVSEVEVAVEAAVSKVEAAASELLGAVPQLEEAAVQQLAAAGSHLAEEAVASLGLPQELVPGSKAIAVLSKVLNEKETLKV